ncbi:MAG: FHA domain-containing protein [Planctomycetaceae bacterium]|nr:FHA domain-containing protein [Planctomycetaceae bacterium]
MKSAPHRDTTDSGFGSDPNPEFFAGWLRGIRTASSTSSANAHSRDRFVITERCQRYVLWIDGVGSWQLLTGRKFLIGAPTLEGETADISLMANLSRKHAAIERIQEDWFIHAWQSTVVSGRTISDRGILRTGDQIQLGQRVRLGFRIPSVLSSSAVVDFESDHRPAHSADGIILMTDTCLLGPRQDYHICCPEWPDLLVLFLQDGELRCRSPLPFRVDQQTIRDVATLSDGATVTGEEFRFRIEKMKAGR